MGSIVENLGVLARCSAQYMGAHLTEETLEGVSLLGNQYVYLLCVCDHPGLTQIEIARLVNFNKSNISRQIVELEKAGFLQRVSVEEGKRTIEIYPTKRAFHLYSEVKRVVNEWQKLMMVDYTVEEQQEIEKVLQKMTMRALSHVTIE
jgi:DNA-binding MarR family transcriptional regulator